MTWKTALFAAVLLSMSFAIVAIAADEDPPDRVARLSYLRGSISFQPAGEQAWVSAIINRPITTGDRLWADQGARAEMHLGSATIRLGGMTGMSFFNLDDRTTQIELSEGTLNIRVARLGRDEIFEVDTPNQAFSILRPGQYRIDASEDGNTTTVTVRAGEGQVTGGGRTYNVDPGMTGAFTGSDSLRASIFRASGYDEFDNWGRDRDHREDSSLSRRYVSADVVGYEDLDDYGSWRSDPAYGYVWVPRVAAGWAPYHYGHWVWISPWGWTWVDDAPWGFAPFHYGRWVYAGNNWGWVPGPVAVRPVYAPALVAFVGGPDSGISLSLGSPGRYVGWFPLGPREVYLPAYRASRDYVGRVNISNTTVNNITITNVYNHGNDTSVRYANRTVQGAVTAVPQTAFTNAQPVGRTAVALNAQQIASARINPRAEVAPTRASVLETATPGGSHANQPPARVINRTIVTKTPPPPPPVPFERQQAKLGAQPGAPLGKDDVDRLRSSANVASAREHVRQAPPGRPAAPDSLQPPTNLPGNARPAPGSTPAVANPPANNAPPSREDRPNRGNHGQQPNAQVPPQAPAPPPANPPNNAPPSREDRPNRGNHGQQPNAQVPPRAPAPPPANPPNNAPPSREDRPNRGNHGQQPATQAPTAPAPAPQSPPSKSEPPSRGRGKQPPEDKTKAPNQEGAPEDERGRK